MHSDSFWSYRVCEKIYILCARVFVCLYIHVVYWCLPKGHCTKFHIAVEYCHLLRSTYYLFCSALKLTLFFGVCCVSCSAYILCTLFFFLVQIDFSIYMWCHSLFGFTTIYPHSIFLWFRSLLFHSNIKHLIAHCIFFFTHTTSLAHTPSLTLDNFDSVSHSQLPNVKLEWECEIGMRLMSKKKIGNQTTIIFTFAAINCVFHKLIVQSDLAQWKDKPPRMNKSIHTDCVHLTNFKNWSQSFESTNHTSPAVLSSALSSPAIVERMVCMWCAFFPLDSR